jgi:phage/plasmid-associated DNA primase
MEFTYRSDVFPNQQYEVQIDLRALEYIMDNLDTLEVGSIYDEKRATGNKLIDIKSEPTLFLNFFKGFQRIKGSHNGSRIDTYTQNKTNPRRMTTTTTSLQGISRIVRHTICREDHLDFDIKNAHPVILKHWCDVHGVNSTLLTDFNENRDQRFAEFKEALNWTKDDTKIFLLKLLNGGNSNVNFKEFEKVKWFEPLINEFKKIRGIIVKQYPNLMKLAVKAKGKDYYNLEGVVVSYLLTNLENQILQHMVSACVRKKIKIGALIYDGFQVYKYYIENEDTFCRYLEEEVKKACGCPIQIVKKEMNEGLVIPDDYKDSAQRLNDQEILQQQKRIEENEKKLQKKEEEKAQKKELKMQEQKQKKELREIEQAHKKDQKRLEKEAKEQDKISDLEYATNFLEEHEGEIVYDKRVGHGYFYNQYTKLWNQFSNFDCLNDSILKTFEGDINMTKVLRNVCFIVKSKIMTREDDLLNFNMKTGLIAIEDNLVFDLSKKQSREREKEDYCTFILKRKYNKDYDRKWVYNYINSLVMPTGEYDESITEQVLELLGYAFTGENNLKLILILHGDEGDNGKSLFLSLVKELLGQYGVQGSSKIYKKSRFESNTHDAHIFPLIGKRGAFTSEMEATDDFNCALLKALSGNDSMSIRNSGSETTFDVILKAVHLIATNEIPRFQDKVFANRLACIPFNNKFERCANKEAEIRSHMDDLFSAILEGAYRYYQRDRKIVLLPLIASYTKSIADGKDSFTLFSKEYEYENGDTKEYCKDLYFGYSEFTRKLNLTPDGKETFYKKVESKFKLIKSKDKKGFFYMINAL